MLGLGSVCFQARGHVGGCGWGWREASWRVQSHDRLVFPLSGFSWARGSDQVLLPAEAPGGNLHLPCGPFSLASSPRPALRPQAGPFLPWLTSSVGSAEPMRWETHCF